MPIPKSLRKEISDKEFADGYVDEFLNMSIATQLKVLREQRGYTQQQLADLAGMKQERISVLENVNYSSWSINTLRKLAVAFDVTLRVSFETFGSRLAEMENFTRKSLQRMSRAEELALDEVPDSDFIATNPAPSPQPQPQDVLPKLMQEIPESPQRTLVNSRIPFPPPTGAATNAGETEIPLPWANDNQPLRLRIRTQNPGMLAGAPFP